MTSSSEAMWSLDRMLSGEAVMCPSIYLTEDAVQSLHPQGAQPGCPAAAAHGEDHAVPGPGMRKSAKTDEEKTF